MPLGISVVGALCAALLGFGCFKAVRLVSQIKAYKEGTKAVNVTLPADFLALQGGFLGGGAAIGRPLTFFRINDEVMGGKSTSSLAVSGRTLEFSGEINTNGGGFCSCRTLGDDAPLGRAPRECREKWRRPRLQLQHASSVYAARGLQTAPRDGYGRASGRVSTVQICVFFQGRA